jgi:hypothetical protein
VALIIPTFRDRDPNEIDRVIGKKRTCDSSSNMDWSKCQLARRYPNWDHFHEALYEERKRPDPHPRAVAPALPPHRAAELLGSPGPSASKINKMFERKD